MKFRRAGRGIDDDVIRLAGVRIHPRIETPGRAELVAPTLRIMNVARKNETAGRQLEDGCRHFGIARLAAVLAVRPYPHFEPAQAPGLLVKIDEDGTRTTGRFVHREFRPARSR